MQHHDRRSIRLPGYDYTRPGAYFVTIVTHDRAPFFGEIVNKELRLNEIGQIAHAAWEWLARQYLYISVDAWIVMPNHTHGIIFIKDTNDLGRGGSRPAPTKTKPLGQLVGAYKTVAAKHINKVRATPGLAVWQRNYYEHIIRDQAEFQTIVDYIQTNPTRWREDRFYAA